MPPKSGKKRQKLIVIKVPLKYKPFEPEPKFPPMSRLYLELLENKAKIKPELRNKEYEPKDKGMNSQFIPSLGSNASKDELKRSRSDEIVDFTPSTDKKDSRDESFKRGLEYQDSINREKERRQLQLDDEKYKSDPRSQSDHHRKHSRESSHRSSRHSDTKSRHSDRNHSRRHSDTKSRHSDSKHRSRHSDSKSRHSDSKSHHSDSKSHHSDRKHSDRSRHNDEKSNRHSDSSRHKPSSRHSDNSSRHKHSSSRHGSDDKHRHRHRHDRHRHDRHSDRGSRHEDRHSRDDSSSSHRDEDTKRSVDIPSSTTQSEIDKILNGGVSTVSHGSVQSDEKKDSSSTQMTPTRPNPIDPPKLSEIAQSGMKREEGGVYSIRVDANEVVERQNLMIKFDTLKRKYPKGCLPEKQKMEYMDISTLRSLYESTVKNLELDAAVENYKKYMMGGFIVMELLLNWIKLDGQGLAQYQISCMNSYEDLLIEIGEKNYFDGPSTWPVEARIAAMVFFNTALFIAAKAASKKMGFNCVGLLNTFMNNNSTANPLADMFQTAQKETPAEQPTSIPTQKTAQQPMMKPPNINIDELLNFTTDKAPPPSESKAVFIDLPEQKKPQQQEPTIYSSKDPPEKPSKFQTANNMPPSLASLARTPVKAN